MVLREDPSSIFSPDVEIENTLGPLSYDVSRVYTGTLEGKFLFLYNKNQKKKMCVLCAPHFHMCERRQQMAAKGSGVLCAFN